MQKKPFVNVVCNLAGVAVDGFIAVLITPILLQGLGDETYSLWIIIGSVTGTFGMLDLGMRSAVGRYVAFYHAKQDQGAIQRVLSTAAVALFGVALMSLALSGVAAWALPRVYEIPLTQVQSVQWATLIVGLQLSLFFVLRMFDAALWGYQRFDLLNLVDIPTTLARAGAISLLIANSGGLIGLAWISLAAIVAAGTAKAWLTFQTTGGLQIRVRHASRSMLAELVGYGWWSFVISVAGLVRSHFSPLLVGSLVGLRAVGPFSIVMRLATMAVTILSAATGVFTPVAVGNHAHEDKSRQQRLLTDGTCLSVSLALYFLAMFFWLGKPLLSLWIRPEFAEHWPLLMIVGCGEILPMAMSVATGVIVATACHRSLAWLSVAETVLALISAVSLGLFTGLLGVVVAFAVTAAVFRGIFVLIYACRLVSMSALTLVWRTFPAPIGCAVASCSVLHIVVSFYPPRTWILLVAYSGLFTIGYGLAIMLVVVGWDRAQTWWAGVFKPRIAEV